MVTEEVQTTSAPDAPTQNYVVRQGSYGAYPLGSVLPEWFISQGNDVAEMVRRRKIEPTAAAVNVSLAAPKQKAANSNVDRDVYEELNRLRADNVRLAEDNRRLLGLMAGADQRGAEQKAELVKLTDENSRFRVAALGHANELSDARAELDKARAEQKLAAADLDRLLTEKRDREAAAKKAKKPDQPPIG